MKRLAVILLLTLLLPQLASAKRIPPFQVDPVVYEGIRYVPSNDDGRRGYIEAWNVGTNKKLWELTLFTNRIDPNLEEDVQRVFINALNIKDGRLMVTSEPGKTYRIDVNTKAITQLDSLSSRSPGAIRDVPNAAHAEGETSVPLLRGDALLVEKTEAASALIYWNGKRYVWSQQGD